ncbi:RNA-binding protein 28 isoform X1 [Dendroctonus ponderosae]|uniref:RRM domain-containing protein n=1 Tax=Dendroctonus ponderosae TaxID=77166 RepID=U4UJY6_DENPD|nr:RNA-binding protein 28 isoform X1 [Dendroctonus ponderosae]ERL90501.1 hypothetical protein D910_07849 [Dendroctonus ponderosae]KAH1012769.1 hypothetical protein HUJ05_011865 [Dendroctonus ponderosae]
MAKYASDHKDSNQSHMKRFKGPKKGKPFWDRKKSKNTLKEKRARLVIKNLPFKATESNIREHFGQHGEVVGVDILKRPDGKLVGCAFVQFSLVQFAKKAQHHTHNHPFLGRNITVDFAQAKDKYVKETTYKKLEVKTEPDEDVKMEASDTIEIKDEELSDPVSSSEENDSDASEEDESEQILETPSRLKPFESHDVNEGKTIFIKNVPFHATNEDLKECMLQFGHLYYALICVDKPTEHSKGTAFVKFTNKEDADKALAAGTELTLLGNILDCHPAIDRNELRQKQNQQNKQKSTPHDSRHLYLVKEGVILAGSKAAEGVSAADMAKRLQIEQYKTQMLRNLNTFVSRERLVVHNLPATWDDKKLKALFQKHAGNEAVVREARIMRDMRNVNAQGVGQSKQFGFVAFTRHEHALAALRSLNNNPNIFSVTHRPIICFSIESKSALKAKLKRQEKSRLKNPKSTDFDPTAVEKDQPGSYANGDEDVQTYAGITAKHGVIQKMRSRYNLSQQAKLHYETIKNEKKIKKLSKKSLSERKKDFTKQPRQKVNKKNQKDNFSELVNNYTKTISNALKAPNKAKWFDRE